MGWVQMHIFGWGIPRAHLRMVTSYHTLKIMLEGKQQKRQDKLNTHTRFTIYLAFQLSTKWFK